MARLKGLLGGLLFAVTLTLALLFAIVGTALAMTPEQAARIAAGDNDARIAALQEAAAAGDPALAPFVRALLADEVKVAGGRAYIVRNGQAVDAATGTAATLPDGAEDVVNNNRMRRELEGALASPPWGGAPSRRSGGHLFSGTFFLSLFSGM